MKEVGEGGRAGGKEVEEMGGGGEEVGKGGRAR